MKRRLMRRLVQADLTAARQRDRQLVGADNVDGVNHQEAAEPVIDLVPERQQAGLAEQKMFGTYKVISQPQRFLPAERNDLFYLS